MATKQGYFLIADITGYTQYLSASELDHAQQTLTALLNLLIQHTKPPLIISRLAGDAVISYGLRDGFLQGQVFVEMIEDTYVSFRRLLELMVRNTTCPCNACRNIGSLDLKFFVHFGDFAVQKLDAHDELVGSEVNMIHRLTKNHVTEATGLKAYTLFTEAAIDHLGLAADVAQLAVLDETYEHLPPVRVYVEDMHPIWEAKRDAMQVRVVREDELYRLETEIHAPPETVWEYFVQPDHFNVLLGGDRVAIVQRKGSRVAVGTVYQCFHGDSIIANAVVGWRPFQAFVVQFVIPTPLGEATSRVELRLDVTNVGTRLAEIFSRSKGQLMARLAADAGMKARREHIRGLVANFKAHIEADLASHRPRVPIQQAISPDEIGASARASLVEAS